MTMLPSILLFVSLTPSSFLIVNEEGVILTTCKFPVIYSAQDKALVCETPPLFSNGFE